MFSLITLWPSFSIATASSMMGPRMSYRTLASLVDFWTVFNGLPRR